LSASSAPFPDREGTIILLPFQIVFLLLTATVMVRSFVDMHRRNHRSWEEIVARLSPEARVVWNAMARNGPDAVVSIAAESPSIAFRNAGVLMDMAGYAEPNGLASHSGWLQPVCRAAIELRVAASSAMLRRMSLR